MKLNECKDCGATILPGWVYCQDCDASGKMKNKWMLVPKNFTLKKRRANENCQTCRALVRKLQLIEAENRELKKHLDALLSRPLPIVDNQEDGSTPSDIMEIESSS